MDITKDAMAGTLESSDVMVRVSPRPELTVDITSTVMPQYGEAIRAVVTDILDQLKVTAGHIIVDDKGALECTLRARLEAAIDRGSEEDIDWRNR